MLAVIKTGGKQYKVAVGDVVRIEKVAGDIGEKLKFDEVLMLSEQGKESVVGAPLVKGASVECEVVNQTRDAKIIVFKKKRRQNYRRKLGHKQQVTYVKVLAVKKK